MDKRQFKFRNLIGTANDKSKIDFLFNYEHKVREIESLCLIRAELERRGYLVRFSCTYDVERINFSAWVQAKVVIAPALYNDATLFAFVYRIAGVTRKVVNLQWEQAISNFDEVDPDFYQNPRGYAKDAVHLCWGDEPRDRLLRSGVAEDRAIVVGAVQMDSLRSEYNELYASREEMASRFSLDYDKDWVLFISSFTYINMDTEEFETEVKVFGERLQDFLQISIISKNEILEWLETAALQYPDKIFIYRPHPSEKGDIRLEKMELKHSNFRVIRDLPIKHWIRASDKILTWYSTSTAEVYFSKKSCAILRPVPLPSEWELGIYNGAKMISDKNIFLESIDQKDQQFPLDESILKRYYNVTEKQSHIRICDLLEEILKTKNYDMRSHRPFLYCYLHIQRFRHRLFFLFKEILSKHNYKAILFNNSFLVNKVKNHIQFMNRMENDRCKSQATSDELYDILQKIIRAK
jgi:surface carbohydrate biosynthesis protein